MAKQIKQIRWFGDGDERSYPSLITKEKLMDKEYFEEYSPILQLSVHTLPGVKMYYNDQTDNPIYVGHSGVYQLDLQDTSAVLYGIHFDQDDLDDIEKTNVGLIIDLMYDNVTEDDSEAETETVITSTGGMASVTVNTNIKNIHKNIWYGVNDKINPYVMERDSQLEKLKAEFAALLDKLRQKYQDTLAHLDPTVFPDAMLNCATCYEHCMRDIIDYYTEAIAALENSKESGNSITLEQGFRGQSENKAVSQKALYDLIARINAAFEGLTANTNNTNGVLEDSIGGQPTLDILLGSEG